MMPAAEFIGRTAGLPRVWGERDCATWPASLVAELTGSDPAARWRGTYASAFECRALVLRSGGLLAMARAGLAGILEEGGEGDGVAVIRARAVVQGRGQIGGIFGAVISGGRPWIKAPAGVLAPPLAGCDMLARWSF